MKIYAYMTLTHINKRAYTHTLRIIKLITKMALVFGFSWSAFPLITGCSSKGCRTKTKKLDGKKLNFTQGASCWRTLTILPSHLSKGFLSMDVSFLCLVLRVPCFSSAFFRIVNWRSLSGLTNVSFGLHQFSENQFRQSRRTVLMKPILTFYFCFQKIEMD